MSNTTQTNIQQMMDETVQQPASATTTTDLKEEKEIKQDSKLFYKIRKYLDLCLLAKKFQRDIGLGKNDENTKAKLANLKQQGDKLREEINSEKPELKNHQDEKDINDESKPNLTTWLQTQEETTGQYFDDDASDDSDNEDAQSILEHKATKKNQKFTLIKTLQTSGFWATARRTSVQDKALSGKLTELKEKSEKQELTKSGLEKKLSGSNTGSKLYYQALCTDLVDRAKIQECKAKTNECAEDDKERARLYTLIRQNPSGLSYAQLVAAKIKIPIFIAQYRGINYMHDRWSISAARYHRTIDEVGDEKHTAPPQFSETVLQTLPFDFTTELKADNDPTKSPEILNTLSKHAQQLKNFFLYLRDANNCIGFTNESAATSYLYNNVFERHQNDFSDGINTYLEYLQKLRDGQKFWGANLTSAHNPAIATGSTPYHALKYAYGLKDYYQYFALPKYNPDGSIKHQHAGKVYVILHTLDELMVGQLHNCVYQQFLEGRNKIRDRVIQEKEISFFGSIGAGKTVYEYVIKYPSFVGDYDASKAAIYPLKYGLDKSLYDSFKYFFSVSKPNSVLYNLVSELLREWLCSYHEVLLIRIAEQNALKQHGALVYFNYNGKISLSPDKALFRKGNEVLANATHIRRGLRRHLAKKSLEKKGQLDQKTCPGLNLATKPQLLAIKQDLDRVNDTALVAALDPDSKIKLDEKAIREKSEKISKIEKKSEGIAKKEAEERLKAEEIKTEMKLTWNQHFRLHDAIKPADKQFVLEIQKCLKNDAKFMLRKIAEQEKFSQSQIKKPIPKVSDQDSKLCLTAKTALSSNEQKQIFIRAIKRNRYKAMNVTRKNLLELVAKGEMSKVFEISCKEFRHNSPEFKCATEFCTKQGVELETFLSFLKMEALKKSKERHENLLKSLQQFKQEISVTLPQTAATLITDIITNPQSQELAKRCKSFFEHFIDIVAKLEGAVLSAKEPNEFSRLKQIISSYRSKGSAALLVPFYSSPISNSSPLKRKTEHANEAVPIEQSRRAKL